MGRTLRVGRAAPSTSFSPTSLNMPMVLTWARVFAIPIFAIVYFLPLAAFTRDMIATTIFVLAAITDYFDGWLARRLKQESEFGGFLDPVADKLIVCTALVFLVELDRVAPAIALIIVTREVFVSALREWMAKMGRSSAVAVDWFGKMKTRAQLIGISLLLYNEILFGWLDCRFVGHWVMVLAAVLTILSMMIYIYRSALLFRRADL